MKFTNIEFRRFLSEELDKGYDVGRIAHKAFEVYQNPEFEITDEVDDILLQLMAMENGAEFEYTESELRELATGSFSADTNQYEETVANLIDHNDIQIDNDPECFVHLYTQSIFIEDAIEQLFNGIDFGNDAVLCHFTTDRQVELTVNNQKITMDRELFFSKFISQMKVYAKLNPQREDFIIDKAKKFRSNLNKLLSDR